MRHCYTSKVEAKIAEEAISRMIRARKIIETVGMEEEYAAVIREQWAKVDIPLITDGERFTLDDGLSKRRKVICYDVYKNLVLSGRIYYQWDPKAKTALIQILR